MRRLVFPVIAAFGLVMVGPSLAFADDPAPTVSVPATAGKKLCKVTDTRLDELSGLVATQNGFVAVDDSTTQDSHKRVFFVDTKCKVTDEVLYSGKGPRDTEDLILSPDKKTLWIADIGDNNYNKQDGTRRDTIGIWKMPADGSKKPTLYRMKYPTGDYHDAEALLITGTNTPLIITKEIDKPASIYQPTGALVANSEEGVPLKKVATLTVSATETPANPLGRIGNKTIVGGAMAPGGDKVVLRTYTDALEWDVTGGEVLAAIKKKPRTTALPNETQGEAITYSADGKYFDTVSDMSGNHDTANYILQYTPATTVAVEKKSSDAAAGGKAWYADLTINQITYTVGAVGLIGLLLVGAGVLGIVRHRRRLADLPPPVDLGRPAGDPETELIGVGGAPQGGGYGGGRPGPGGPGVYGGGPGGPGQRSGPVYGAGGGAGGPQYGRPQQGGQGRPQQAPRPQQPGVYGGQGGGGGGQYGQPRGPQQGQRPQRPAGPPPGGGQQPRPQQGQRPPGGQYGQQGGRDGYADRNARPDDRFDNPGYRR